MKPSRVQYPAFIRETDGIQAMRINFNIDDALMAKAMAASESKTRKGTVEQALRLFVQIQGQKKILPLRGKLHWEGPLDEMRSDE